MTVKQSKSTKSKKKQDVPKERIPIRIIIPGNLDTPSELQLRHDIEEMYNNSQNRYHITYEQEVRNVDDLFNMASLKETAREGYRIAAKMDFKKGSKKKK